MGVIGQKNAHILVDSGAAVSAVHKDLCAGCLIKTGGPQTETVGANGMPLDVLGQTTLTVQLGDFQVEQDFLVVRDLSVDCLLGANFLTRHDALIDCGRMEMTLGGPGGVRVPLSNSASCRSKDCYVTLQKTVEVPARMVLLVQGKLENALIIP